MTDPGVSRLSIVNILILFMLDIDCKCITEFSDKLIFSIFSNSFKIASDWSLGPIVICLAPAMLMFFSEFLCCSKNLRNP